MYLVVLSGINPSPCVLRIFTHRLVFGETQNAHVLHSGVYRGMTWSPTAYSVTFSPTLSTIPPPSCPRIEGNLPSGSLPESVYASVWQRAHATIFTRTSPARGGSTSISSTESGWPGAYATAALHFITFGSDILPRSRKTVHGGKKGLGRDPARPHAKTLSSARSRPRHQSSLTP